MISLWLIDRSSLAFGASEIGLGLIFYSVNISFLFHVGSLSASTHVIKDVNYVKY